MKVPPTTVIRFANLLSLVFLGKNKVGYFLDRPRRDILESMGLLEESMNAQILRVNSTKWFSLEMSCHGIQNRHNICWII
jgi:hypothetical protein